jgi:hypothetical protein
VFTPEYHFFETKLHLIQDFSQLKKDYGREQADVVVNTIGNIISGQVMGENSKFLSEQFGKII